MCEHVRTYAMRFSHTARRCSGGISSFDGAAVIEGGGGRTSEKVFEGALPDPEGVVEEVSAEGLSVVVGMAAGDMGTGAAVPLRELVETTTFSFSDERSPGGIGGLKTLLGGGSGGRSKWGGLKGEGFKVNCEEEADRNGRHWKGPRGEVGCHLDGDSAKARQDCGHYGANCSHEAVFFFV